MKRYLPYFPVLLILFVDLKQTPAQYVDPINTLSVLSTCADIAIDGEADASYSDWQSTMIAKEAGTGVTPHAGDDTDFNFRFKLTWDLNYLYFLADVIDDVEENYALGKAYPWSWDNVEVFIDLDTNSTTQDYSTTSTTHMRFCRGLLDSKGNDSIVESNSRRSGQRSGCSCSTKEAI